MGAAQDVLPDGDLVRGRVGGEVLAVDRETDIAARLDGPETVGERHLSELAVVAVGLPVGRDMHEFGASPVRGERAEQPPGKPPPVGEQVPERDVAGDHPIVEEDGDAPARGEAAEVGHPRLDPAAGDVCPALRPDRPHPPCLVGARIVNRIPAPAIRSRDSMSTAVSGATSFGFPAELCGKVADTPGDLNLFLPVSQAA